MQILVARFHEDGTWESDIVDSPEKAMELVKSDPECKEVVIGRMDYEFGKELGKDNEHARTVNMG